MIGHPCEHGFSAYLCTWCGAAPTRESEGWTTTLAKLIGPCGTPVPQRAACRYEYYHAPDSRCNECDWVGAMVQQPTFKYVGPGVFQSRGMNLQNLPRRTRPTIAACPDNNLHGAGMTCRICGYIGNIRLARSALPTKCCPHCGEFRYRCACLAA